MFQIYSHSNDQLGEGQGGQSAEGGVPWGQGRRGQQQQEGPWHQLQSMYITLTHIYSFFLTISMFIGETFIIRIWLSFLDIFPLLLVNG